jgi:UDP-N-acetylglucosamine 2-epimerase (non-hydrolysing)
MDEGTLIMCDLVASRVIDAVRTVTDHALRDRARFRVPQDYEPTDVSRKVVRIILSYVDFVRRTVWFDQRIAT